MDQLAKMDELIQETQAGTTLLIHVQPRAAKTEYVGIHGGALKFRVAAPPVEGAANEALCRYLARLCSLPKKRVMISSGEGARKKRVLLKGVSSSKICELLEAQNRT